MIASWGENAIIIDGHLKGLVLRKVKAGGKHDRELDDLTPGEVLAFGIVWIEWRGGSVKSLEFGGKMHSAIEDDRALYRFEERTKDGCPF